MKPHLSVERRSHDGGGDLRPENGSVLADIASSAQQHCGKAQADHILRLNQQRFRTFPTPHLEVRGVEGSQFGEVEVFRGEDLLFAQKVQDGRLSQSADSHFPRSLKKLKAQNNWIKFHFVESDAKT